MTMTDDDQPRRPLAAHVVGQDLSLLSVADLRERIALLRAEIARLEAEGDARGGVKSAAEALFRR